MSHILRRAPGPLIAETAVRCAPHSTSSSARRTRRSTPGRIGLINSGGESSGANDLRDAVKTAVVNKRAGGMGLISGRKAFQRPLAQGVELLNAIQDVYLAREITVA